MQWSESASARPFKSVLGEETSTWANKGLHWAFDHVRQSGFSLQRVEFHKGCSPKVSYYTKSCWWVVAFFKSSRYLNIPPCRVSPVLIWASSTPPTYHIFICKKTPEKVASPFGLDCCSPMGFCNRAAVSSSLILARSCFSGKNVEVVGDIVVVFSRIDPAVTRFMLPFGEGVICSCRDCWGIFFGDVSISGETPLSSWNFTSWCKVLVVSETLGRMFRCWWRNRRRRCRLHRFLASRLFSLRVISSAVLRSSEEKLKRNKSKW